MKCTNCGNELPADGKFCEHCGAKIEVAEVPEAAPVQEVPVAEAPVVNTAPKAKTNKKIFNGSKTNIFGRNFKNHAKMDNAGKKIGGIYESKRGI